jgi:hypothetical protein
MQTSLRKWPVFADEVEAARFYAFRDMLETCGEGPRDVESERLQMQSLHLSGSTKSSSRRAHIPKGFACARARAGARDAAGEAARQHGTHPSILHKMKPLSELDANESRNMVSPFNPNLCRSGGSNQCNRMGLARGSTQVRWTQHPRPCVRLRSRFIRTTTTRRSEHRSPSQALISATATSAGHACEEYAWGGHVSGASRRELPQA